MPKREGLSAWSSSFSSFRGATARLSRLQVFEDVVQASEVAFPILAIALEPRARFREGAGLESARAPLSVASARDEPGPLEHLEMFRDRRLAHFEGGGELHDRSIAARQTSEDGASGRIRERRERGVEGMGLHER